MYLNIYKSSMRCQLEMTQHFVCIHKLQMHIFVSKCTSIFTYQPLLQILRSIRNNLSFICDKM